MINLDQGPPFFSCGREQIQGPSLAYHLAGTGQEDLADALASYRYEWGGIR